MRDLRSPSATDALGAALAALARPGDVVLLEGELGAGKTTLARAFVRAVADDAKLDVPSPTFTLVQTYETMKGPVHHFDLWRLDGPGALRELGWDEAREGIVLVEWPDRLGPLRPTDGLTLAMLGTGANSRRARLEGWPDRLGRIA